MTVETGDTEFRHPEAVAFLESLTDEQAARQLSLVLEQDGVATRQRCESGGRRNLGVRQSAAAVRALERLVQSQGGGGAVLRSAVDPNLLRGDSRRTESDLNPRLVQCPQLRGCRHAGADVGRKQTEAVDGLDQGAAERWADRPSHRRSEAAPRPLRSHRLHPYLRGQRGPNALQPLPEARTAGRLQHRGRHLQANRQQPIQMGGVSLVKGRSQCSARCQMLLEEQPLARLPRVEGLWRRSRITKENGMHPSKE